MMENRIGKDGRIVDEKRWKQKNSKNLYGGGVRLEALRYEQAARTVRKTVYNATTLSQEIEYDIDEDLDYRIKVEVTDTYNGLTTTVTTYEYLVDPS